MPPSTTIPRFLLPQAGAIWRARISQPSSTSMFIRNASKSSKKASKPLVLEKPAKFNPPSHGSRRPREAPRYPGPQLSAEEKAAQDTKKYPNMMPPEGSFMHWFIHNRGLHLWITLGTLFGMASIIWVTNFKRNSPFADMLPSWGQFFWHPIDTTGKFLEVVKLNSAHMSAETAERRARRTEDVQKRAAYRKAHGLDNNEGFGGWTAKTGSEMLGPGIPVGDVVLPQESNGEGEGETSVVSEQQVVRHEKKPLKKWLGIW